MNKTKHLIIAATALTALTAANTASAYFEAPTFYWDVACHQVIFTKSPNPANPAKYWAQLKRPFMNCTATPTKKGEYPAKDYEKQVQRQGSGTFYMCPQTYKDVGWYNDPTLDNNSGWWANGVNGDVKGKLHTRLNDLSALGSLLANPGSAFYDKGSKLTYTARFNPDPTGRDVGILGYVGGTRPVEPNKPGGICKTPPCSAGTATGTAIVVSNGQTDALSKALTLTVTDLEPLPDGTGSTPPLADGNYNWWGTGEMQIRNTPCQQWPLQRS